MSQSSQSSLTTALEALLTAPRAEGLWRLQADLLAMGTDAAHKARDVAGRFHGFLCDLESKVASRSASRMSALLTTASVSSVGLQEMLAEKKDPLRRLFASGVTAMLEVAGAAKGVEAWEVESALVYYDVAWYLYGELWDVSLAGRPELSVDQRRTLLDSLLRPVFDPEVDDAVKSAVLVRFFQIVLAARLWPLLKSASE